MFLPHNVVSANRPTLHLSLGHYTRTHTRTQRTWIFFSIRDAHDQLLDGDVNRPQAKCLVSRSVKTTGTRQDWVGWVKEIHIFSPTALRRSLGHTRWQDVNVRRCLQAIVIILFFNRFPSISFLFFTLRNKHKITPSLRALLLIRILSIWQKKTTIVTIVEWEKGAQRKEYMRHCIAVRELSYKLKTGIVNLIIASHSTLLLGRAFTMRPHHFLFFLLRKGHLGCTSPNQTPTSDDTPVWWLKINFQQFTSYPDQ